MDLKEIATVAGKSGLYKVLSPTRTGVILESLDEKKKRFPVGGDSRVSILQEISIYTTDEEGAVPLEDVFRSIHEEFGDDPGVETSSPGDELKAFLKHVLPNYDEERVYVSDMKKLVQWYKLLLKNLPEFFESEPEAAVEEGGEEPEATNDAADKE